MSHSSITIQDFLAGRIFYTTWGVVAALTTDDPSRTKKLYLARIVFFLALILKCIVAVTKKRWFDANSDPANISLAYIFVIFGAVILGLCVTAFDDFCWNPRFKKIVVQMRNGGVKHIKGTRLTEFGLFPSFLFCAYGIVLIAEMSKPPAEFKYEILGAIYDLILFLASLFRGGAFIWWLVEKISLRDAPHVF